VLPTVNGENRLGFVPEIAKSDRLQREKTCAAQQKGDRKRTDNALVDARRPMKPAACRPLLHCDEPFAGFAEG
jgi:hypothetical protein